MAGKQTKVVPEPEAGAPEEESIQVGGEGFIEEPEEGDDSLNPFDEMDERSDTVSDGSGAEADGETPPEDSGEGEGEGVAEFDVLRCPKLDAEIIVGGTVHQTDVPWEGNDIIVPGTVLEVREDNIVLVNWHYPDGDSEEELPMLHFCGERCPLWGQDDCKGRASDRSASIPAVPETFSYGGDHFGDVFSKDLPVYLSDVELGCYSEEQARLFRLYMATEERKKAQNKALNDQIKDIRKKLDEISTIVEEGSAERPVECRYAYDLQRNEKILIRLDTGKEVERKTIEKDEMAKLRQLPLFSEQSSVAAVQEAFGQGSESEPVENILGDEENAANWRELAEGGDSEVVQECECGEQEYCEICCPPSAPAPVASFDEDVPPNMSTIPASDAPTTVEEIAGSPVVEGDLPPQYQIDKDRKCCMPTDRDFITDGDIRTLFCRVCGLILRKEDTSGSVWQRIDFTPGEKVDLTAIPARVAP